MLYISHSVGNRNSKFKLLLLEIPQTFALYLSPATTTY